MWRLILLSALLGRALPLRRIFRGGALLQQREASLASSVLPARAVLDLQTWPARELVSDGRAFDSMLVWSELRQRITSTDARLLLRTSALDLAIRDRCVVFDFGVLRGYVEDRRAVFLLEPDDGSQSRNRPSRHHALAVEGAVREVLAKGADDTVSFALVVLECVLEEAYEHALRRFVRLDAAIRKELATMTDLRQADAAPALYRLLPLETQLRDEAVRGRRVYALVSDALRDDGLLHPDHVLVMGANNVQTCEAVFENSLCRWEFVNDAIETLVGTIDATRKLVELALDNERNRIERMDIYLNIGGLGLALISAVGGFFGMNLLIGWETKLGVFNSVVLLTTFSAISLCLVCFAAFRSGMRRNAGHVDDMVASFKRSLTPAVTPTSALNRGFAGTPPPERIQTGVNG